MSNYITEAPELDRRATVQYLVHLMSKKLEFSPLQNLVRQLAFRCNRRIAVCLHRKPRIKKETSWAEKYSSPEEVIKSKNVKSILVKKKKFFTRCFGETELLKSLWVQRRAHTPTLMVCLMLLSQLRHTAVRLFQAELHYRPYSCLNTMCFFT